MKLKNGAVVSKFGSKISENAARKIVKKIQKIKSTVYTVSPITVDGAKMVESLENLKKIKLDLVITLGGDGTTLRTFRNLQNETPILTINVGGNRGILSEITLNEFDKVVSLPLNFSAEIITVFALNTFARFTSLTNAFT